MGAKIGCVIVVIIVVLLMMISTESAAKIDCETVIQKLSPCLGYIRTGGGKKPFPACCDGVRSLNNAAVTTPDRQTACTCLKQIAAGFSPAAIALAATIPDKCDVSIPYKIDPKIDCSKIR